MGERQRAMGPMGPGESTGRLLAKEKGKADIESSEDFAGKSIRSGFPPSHFRSRKRMVFVGALALAVVGCVFVMTLVHCSLPKGTGHGGAEEKVVEAGRLMKFNLLSPIWMVWGFMVSIANWCIQAFFVVCGFLAWIFFSIYHGLVSMLVSIGHFFVWMWSGFTYFFGWMFHAIGHFFWSLGGSAKSDSSTASSTHHTSEGTTTSDHHHKSIAAALLMFLVVFPACCCGGSPFACRFGL